MKLTLDIKTEVGRKLLKEYRSKVMKEYHEKLKKELGEKEYRLRMRKNGSKGGRPARNKSGEN